MRAVNFRWPTVGPKGLAATVMLVLTLAILRQQTVRTAPATSGQWTTLTRLMPINPVHVALLNNGKVLIVSGSGNVAANTDFESAIWDPRGPRIPSSPGPSRGTCSAMA